MTAKNRKINLTIILLIILAVLAIGFIFFRHSDEKKQVIINQPELFIKDFKRDAIAKIEVTSPTAKSAIIVKNADQWQLADQNNYPADSELINNILETLNTVKITETVSKNPDNYSRFDLVEGKAIRVKMSDSNNNELYNILIGKAGPNFFDSYAKMNDGNSVYLLEKNLNIIFNQSEWIKRTVLSLKTEDIQEISIYQKAKPTYRFERKDNTIILAFPQANDNINQETAQSFFSNIAQLQTKGIIQQPDKELGEYGLSNDALTFKINLTLKDGAAHEYRFGKKENNAYYLQVDDNPIIFTPADGDVERFEVKVKNLAPTATK